MNRIQNNNNNNNKIKDKKKKKTKQKEGGESVGQRETSVRGENLF